MAFISFSTVLFLTGSFFSQYSPHPSFFIVSPAPTYSDRPQHSTARGYGRKVWWRGGRNESLRTCCSHSHSSSLMYVIDSCMFGSAAVAKYIRATGFPLAMAVLGGFRSHIRTSHGTCKHLIGGRLDVCIHPPTHLHTRHTHRATHILQTIGDGEKPTPRILADVRKTRVWRDFKHDCAELQGVDLSGIDTEAEKVQCTEMCVYVCGCSRMCVCVSVFVCGCVCVRTWGYPCTCLGRARVPPSAIAHPKILTVLRRYPSQPLCAHAYNHALHTHMRRHPRAPTHTHTRTHERACTHARTHIHTHNPRSSLCLTARVLPQPLQPHGASRAGDCRPARGPHEPDSLL